MEREDFIEIFQRHGVDQVGLNNEFAKIAEDRYNNKLRALTIFPETYTYTAFRINIRNNVTYAQKTDISAFREHLQKCVINYFKLTESPDFIESEEVESETETEQEIVCPDCPMGGNIIIERGKRVCTNCGLELTDSIISADQTEEHRTHTHFVETNRETKVRDILSKVREYYKTLQGNQMTGLVNRQIRQYLSKIEDENEIHFNDQKVKENIIDIIVHNMKKCTFKELEHLKTILKPNIKHYNKLMNECETTD